MTEIEIKLDAETDSSKVLKAVQNGLINFPTADVAPIIHAHRENAISMCGQTYKRCSHCGSRLSAVKTRFYAHCGAMFVEEVKEDGTQ